MPSKAWSLVLSPSLTFTETTTVSPGLNEGISVLICLFSKSLTIWAGDFSTRETLTTSSAGASSVTASSATASSAGASSVTASSAGASSI